MKRKEPASSDADILFTYIYMYWCHFYSCLITIVLSPYHWWKLDDAWKNFQSITLILYPHWKIQFTRRKYVKYSSPQQLWTWTLISQKVFSFLTANCCLMSTHLRPLLVSHIVKAKMCFLCFHVFLFHHVMCNSMCCSYDGMIEPNIDIYSNRPTNS